MNDDHHTDENTLLGISLDNPVAFAVAMIGGCLILALVLWMIYISFTWTEDVITTALRERSDRIAQEQELRREELQTREQQEQQRQQEYQAQQVQNNAADNFYRNRPGAHLEQGTLVLTATRPDHIVIDKIDVDSVIKQPVDPNIHVLDEALQEGAVHYPGSGTLERGNMFIFGHSTNWPIVQNQAYKTFNNLEDLVLGDEIKVQADGKEYVYIVQTVELVDESAAFVDLSQSQRMLTISTCNSFGKKQDRWVVQAVFDREYVM